MATWDEADSPLWDAKGYMDDALDALEPGTFDDPLTEEEKAVTLPLRGMAVTLSAAMKPTADEIVPAIDNALVEMRSMKQPTPRVSRAIKRLENSREAFAALSMEAIVKATAKGKTE